jgi:1,2-diacylglycerol 3-alpha-glucosyltransferase
MKIGIFTDTYFPNVNGVVRSIETLRENLEKRGHEVYIITTVKLDKKEDKVLRVSNLPIEVLEGYKVALPYSNRVFRAVKKLELDVIHTHTEWSIGAFARICSKRLGIPMVHTFHTMYENYLHYITKQRGQVISKQLMKSIVRGHSNSAKYVIAPSLKAKNTLENYKVRSNIEVVPTGIELGKFKQNIDKEIIERKKEELKIDKNEFVAMYLGRLAKEKNIEPIIKAVLNIKTSNFKLVIVGDGPERENLEKVVKENRLENKVIFTGQAPMEEVPMYYKMANLFIQASNTETQGLTIFEAMASGTPLLVRFDTNINNFFEDRVECVYFNEENEISDKINELIENKDLLNYIRKNALERIDEFSAEKFAENIEKIYEAAIKLKKSRNKKRIKLKFSFRRNNSL